MSKIIYDSVRNFTGGEFVPSKGTRKNDIINHLNDQIISSVDLSCAVDLNNAVTAEKKAFPRAANS